MKRRNYLYSLGGLIGMSYMSGRVNGKRIELESSVRDKSIATENGNYSDVAISFNQIKINWSNISTDSDISIDFEIKYENSESYEYIDTLQVTLSSSTDSKTITDYIVDISDVLKKSKYT